MYTPQFTRPVNPVSFAGPGAYYTFLEQHGIAYEGWGKKNIEKAWKEVEQSDALYSLTNTFGVDGFEAATRHIRTATARITHEKVVDGKLVREVLREYEIKDGVQERRKHEDSSVSEKIRFAHGDVPEELPWQAIQRALHEELGIDVPDSYFTEDGLRIYPPKARGLQTLGLVDHIQKPHVHLHVSPLDRNVEIDERTMGRFAPLLTHNQLVHYLWNMPNEFYRPGGYRDRNTRYVSRWEKDNGI